MFSRYWEAGDAGIQTYEGMAESVAELGVDVDLFVEKAESPEVREELINVTQRALTEGIFGAPTMVVDDEIYWGKDRFEFIEDHLKAS